MNPLHGIKEVYSSNSCAECGPSFARRTARAAVPTWIARWLVLFVLIGFVDSQAAEFIRDFQQVLVTLVPFGADFAEEHRSLIGPAELQISDFADVRAEPASVFHVIAVGELGVGQALYHF